MDNMPKTTGTPRDFGTGAKRDNSEGKGRCDLLPLKEVAFIMKDKVLEEIALFYEDKDIDHIRKAIENSIQTVPEYKNFPNMFLEVSFLYESGAKTYGENNWSATCL